MLNAEFVPENPFPDVLPKDQLPDAKRLSPHQRLDAIARILAVAAHRNRFRKAQIINNVSETISMCCNC